MSDTNAAGATRDPQVRLIDKLRLLPMRNGWLRWGVLACCLSFSAAGTYHFYYLGVVREARSSFSTLAIGIRHDLDSRIRAYEDVLYAMRGLFDASDKIGRKDFREFAAALALPKRYPGITNIHYGIRLFDGQKPAFERAVRAAKDPLTEGLPQFSIKPPGERPEYLVLHYIEPLARSAIAWGIDLNMDPRRRPALERARDTGQLAATSGITLESDAKSPSRITSVLFRLAVYRGKGVPSTVEDRQRLYSGMVGSTIRIGEMIEAALPSRTLARVRVIVHEESEASAGGTQQSTGMLLYDSAAGESGLPAPDYSAYAVTEQLAVGDRKWRLDLVPLVNPVNALSQGVVAMVAAGAFAVSLLLFWLMGLLAVAQARGVELAKRNRSAVQFGKLGEDLYSSLARQEAYQAIVRHVPDLLPETAGALFVFDASRSSAAVAAHWGAPDGIGVISTPNDCQALRRGHLHSVPDSAQAPNCAHFKGPPPRSYACVPLSAQGELIGVLHLQRSPPSSSSINDAEIYVVRMLAQHAGLALANLDLREKLQEQATRDKLTGLYNRHYMEEWFEQELKRAARHKRRLGVVLMDIDHFKRINDSFGHEAGDIVLKALGDLLKRSIRGSDVACRYGGEEFLLLLGETSVDAARTKAEALRESIKQLDLKFMDQPLGRITASLGVAVYPVHAADSGNLLRVADESLYRAKNDGRDRVVLASADDPQPA